MKFLDNNGNAHDTLLKACFSDFKTWLKSSRKKDNVYKGVEPESVKSSEDSTVFASNVVSILDHQQKLNGEDNTPEDKNTDDIDPDSKESITPPTPVESHETTQLTKEGWYNTAVSTVETFDKAIEHAKRNLQNIIDTSSVSS